MFLLTALLTLNLWIFFILTNSQIFQTTTGCPIIQLNSDTNYPELVSVSTLDASAKYWLSGSVQFSSVQFSSVTQSCPTLCDPRQHARPPCPSSTPRVYPNSRPSSRWCHPAISSSVIPFSSCPQPLPASESFPMSHFFASGGQSIGISASVLPMDIQDWYPSGLTGWISLQSEELSSVFSNTTIQNHQLFGAQVSL